MAKRKDDVSFGFKSSLKKKEAPPPAETPAETPADSSDPFASSTDASADPFASTETPADPFATTDSSSADPFASTDTPAADASSDPFASSTDSSSADPFATTTDAPDASADPFASTTDAPADAVPADESPSTETASPKSAPAPKQHKQFRILILGDFSGRTNRGIVESPDAIARRKVRTVDQDTLEKVLAAMAPEIQLPVSETSVIPLSFAAMEDFRPDALLGKIEAFQGMLKLRAQLKDAKKFKEAAAAVRKLTGTAAPKKAKTPHEKTAPAAGGESDFERLMNQPVAPKDATTASADAIIANLVAGYSVPDADPEQGKMVQLVEDAMSAGLRAVLRHPAFQALEGAWRGVEFLTSRLNTDDDLKLSIFDISKDELYQDLTTAATIQKSAMFQILVEQTKVPGASGFAMVVGDYEFEQVPRDIALLAKIATLMHEAGLPFVAGATAKVAGAESFTKLANSAKWQPPADLALWEKIRGHKLAAHLGLAAPGFLLRMPYGPKTDAIEAYPFDEMPSSQPPVIENYLWGNSAFAVAVTVGEAFLEAGGWEFQPGTDVGDLPCHMAMVDGDKEMTPCAQAWLSDRMGDVLHTLGIIPVISVKNMAAVKIAGMHSIAKGGKPLAAAWVAG